MTFLYATFSVGLTLLLLDRLVDKMTWWLQLINCVIVATLFIGLGHLTYLAVVPAVYAGIVLSTFQAAMYEFLTKPTPAPRDRSRSSRVSW
jgi:hypothetical protein